MELEEAKKTMKNFLKDTPKLPYDCIANHEIVAVETILNHLTKQEKLIDLMISKIDEYAEHDDEMCMQDNYYCDEDCKTCIKQYFEKKAEESE